MHKNFWIKFTFVALTVALASSAFAEQKQKTVVMGNNVWLSMESKDWSAPFGGSHQFPAGSPNIYKTSTASYGVMIARDVDGDGVPEDTVIPGSRGSTMIGSNCSLESYTELEALYNSGANMQEASNLIAHNRLWIATNPGDLDDWPPEFREGRSAAGDPIINGNETVCVRIGDPFLNEDTPMGVSLEYRVTILSFGQSNNMVYGHTFLRNMSEYIKWNEVPAYVERMSATPDGQVWHGMQLIFSNRNAYIGTRDELFAYHSKEGISAIVDKDGSDANFIGIPAIWAQKLIRVPSRGAETMELTNFNASGYGTFFGITPTQDILESNYPDGKAYRCGRGYNAVSIFPGIDNPWNPGTQLIGMPGLLREGDAKYDEWLWGNANMREYYTIWGEMTNFVPRDSTSFDWVLMWVYPELGADLAMVMPEGTIANLWNEANDKVQAQMEPVVEYGKIAQANLEGGYRVPMPPVLPPMTIIPGDKQVTITWSDLSLQTPDPYYAVLQEYPDMDPEGKYVEYDFEGFQLWRSYAAPSDLHAVKLLDVSKSDGNIQYFYIDRKDDDNLYRMNNGQKAWYKLVAFDKNIDLSTDEWFSLSGIRWNRPGEGIYTVIPRSNASEFKAASADGEITFNPAQGSPAAGESFELSGPGDGSLSEAPVYLEPVTSFEFEPIINERITSAKTVYFTTTGTWIAYGTGNNRSTRTFQITEGGSTGIESGEMTVRNRNGSSKAVFPLTGPVDAEGANYVITATFEYMSNGDFRSGLFYHMDTDTYTGGEPGAVSSRGDNNRSGGYPPGIPGQIRAGRFTLTWQSGGAGLTLQVQDQTRGYTLPSVEFPDQNYGWGFVTMEIFGDDDFEARGNLYNDMLNGVPFADRDSKMISSLPADNTDEFAIWVNGMLWVLRDVSSMPSVGTVFAVDNAFGKWNSDKTVFTQQPDPPFPGDSWEIKISPMSLDPNDADLSKIRVVPNPYLASSYLDLSPDLRRIEFVNLPARCTIRIYSMGGHLVNVLNHIGANRHGWGNYLDYDRLDANSQPREFTGWDNHGGTEPWNLRNRFGQTVASGLYFYHVSDVRGETHTGKLYIVN